MFVISSRKGGTDARAFADWEHLFQISSGGDWTEKSFSDLFSRVEGKRVLVLVHGFNNPFDFIKEEYRKAAYYNRRYFNGHYDLVVGYLWPGGNSHFDYFLAREHTATAAGRLRHWLAELYQNGAQIDLMGHSLAAQVGYRMLESEPEFTIGNVFSFGAAISERVLASAAKLESLLAKVRTFFAFYTRDDVVLKYGFRLLEQHTALGYTGPVLNRKLEASGKINAIDCTGLIANHSGYLNSEPVLTKVGEILKKQAGVTNGKLKKAGVPNELGKPVNRMRQNYKIQGSESSRPVWSST